MQKKILLVDDEPSLRRTLTLGLTQAGYDTEPCENGIISLKKLESYAKNNIKLDGIVSDIHLPDIDGLKLVKIMKFKYPGIPIILITGFADRYSMDEIRHLDVDAFMEKPFSPQELVDEFVKIMKARKPEEEEAKEEKPGATAYILIRVAQDANFADTYKDLHVLDPVVYCDATRGDHDIILFVQEKDAATIRNFVENKVKKVEGVESAELMMVDTPILDEATHHIIKDAQNILEYYSAVGTKAKNRKVCSYIMLEVQREKMNDVFPVLRLEEDVLFCDYTQGKYNLVLMVKADYFSNVDAFISEHVNTLDGINNVKKYPIINVFDM